MLSRDSILSSSDLPTEEVPVPEWGGTVFVRTMSGTERDNFEQVILEGKSTKGGTAKMVNVRAKLAVKVLVDEQGKRLFTDEDAGILGSKSGKALDRIFEVAQRLAGIGEKDIAELEKNS
jgi:hypothetical protein